MNSPDKDAEGEEEVVVPIAPSRERWLAMSPREQLEFLRMANEALERKRKAEGKPRFALIEAMEPEARPLLDRLAVLVEHEERQRFADQLAAIEAAEQWSKEEAEARKRAREQVAMLMTELWEKKA